MGSFLTALLLIVTGCGRAPEPGVLADDVGALEQETAALKSRLATARSRIDALRGELGQGGVPIAPDGLAAPNIIDELAATKLTSGNRRLVQRRMDYLFENLAEQGEQGEEHAEPRR